MLLKDMFNVELNIIPEQDGTYSTRMEAGSLGDIVVWGANGDDYKNAVAKNMLLDWEQFDLGKKYGSSRLLREKPTKRGCKKSTDDF